MSYEDLIEQVKEHPEIYQRQHPLYKNKMRRQRVWNQISKSLGIDCAQLKKNWKYLIDQYRREFKKMNAAGSYEGMPVPSGWAHYDTLSFLKDEMEIRQERRPARHSDDSDTNANETTFQESFDDSAFETTWTHRQAKPNPSLPSGSGVTKADLILRKLDHISQKLDRSDDVQKDDDYMFFMSILPTVRNLSPLRKLQLRVKVNEWLVQLVSEDSTTDPLNNENGDQYVQVEFEDNKDSVMKIVPTKADVDN